MSLYDQFMAGTDEPTDDPGVCTKCGEEAWWNDEEDSLECDCGFFEQCDDCGWFPMWDPEEEAWFCVCGYDFS